MTARNRLLSDVSVTPTAGVSVGTWNVHLVEGVLYDEGRDI